MRATLDDYGTYLAHVKTRRPVVDKDDLIVDLCRGRSVLDIGCIDHSAETALGLGDRWLHHRIGEAATEAVGLDILAEEAAKLNDLGYDIRAGDATAFDLGRTFDVIVSGDIVEHLDNVGLFLGCVRRHLADDGRFVMTTPNAFNIEQAARILFLGDVRVHEQHVAYYDPTVMFELVHRCGFAIERFEWVHTRFDMAFESPKRSARAVNWLTRQASRVRPMFRRDFALVLRRGSAEPE